MHCNKLLSQTFITAFFSFQKRLYKHKVKGYKFFIWEGRLRMKISTIGQKLVNQVKPVVNTAAKAVKKNPLLFGAGALGLYLGYKLVDTFTKSDTNTGIIPEKNEERCFVRPENPGLIPEKKEERCFVRPENPGLIPEKKEERRFVRPENPGIIPEKKEERCFVRPKKPGIIPSFDEKQRKPYGIITIQDLIDAYIEKQKKPVTIQDLIDAYIEKQKNNKGKKIKDILVYKPNPINPADNPYVDKDKYDNFMKKLEEIRKEHNFADLDKHRIPENLTPEERIEYFREHGGPGLIYNC